MHAWLIDRDGVLNRAKGGGALPEAVEWMKDLVRQSVPFVVATNETTSSPEQVHRSLTDEGFPVQPWQVHTPLSILFHVFETSPPGRVYVRGTDKLKDHLRSRGVDVVDDARVDTVLLGFDRAMTYEGISCVVEAVVDHGANLIALHENHLFRGPGGHPEPGLGAWVRAVEYATGAEALIIGKPTAAYYRAALEKLGVEARDATMVSDDPIGDLQGAKRLGMRTVFVLSGKYGDRKVLSSPQVKLQPDRIEPTLAHVEV